MIEELKPYPEYKDTSSAWLKAVPKHWGIQRLRSLIKPQAERDRPDLPLLSVARERGVFVRSLTDLDENHNVIPDDLSNYKVARRGNLVINKMKAWQGSMGIAPCDGIVSPAYFVFDLRIANGLFAQALFRSKPYVAHFGQASDGVRIGQWDLSIPGMREIPVLLPPPDEQAAIVRFLDWWNGKIERAIRAKRKLIALLTEQKQAIIHRAVTRGLDPAAKLKPSGIPWLAETPPHWEWMPIKRLLSAVDYGTSEASNAEGRIRVLTMGNIQRGEVVLPKSGGLDAVPDVLLLEHYDILFTRTNGNPDLVGKVGIFRGHRSDEVSFASYLVRFRVNKSHDPRWMHYVLNSAVFWAFARSHALVNLQTNLNSKRYCRFVVPVPPHDEQIKIVAAIEAESQILNSAISRTEREIDLLREYRTTLTAEAVTGKFDVREAEKRLPAKADEPLPADDIGETEELEAELLEDEE